MNTRSASKNRSQQRYHDKTPNSTRKWNGNRADTLMSDSSLFSPSDSAYEQENIDPNLQDTPIQAGKQNSHLDDFYKLLEKHAKEHPLMPHIMEKVKELCAMNQLQKRHWDRWKMNELNLNMSEMNHQLEMLSSMKDALRKSEQALETANGQRHEWEERCREAEDKLDDALSKVRKYNQEKEDAYREMQRKIQRLENSENKWEEQRMEMEKEMKTMKRHCDMLEDSKKAVDRERKRLSMELLDAQRQLDQGREYVETSLGRIDNVQEQLEITLRKLEQKHRDWNEAQQEIVKLQKDCETWKLLGEQEHQKVQRIIAEGSALEARCHDMAKEKENMHAKMQSYIYRRDKSQGNVENLKAHYEHLLLQRQQELMSAEQQLQQLRFHLQHERDQSEQLRKELASYRENVQMESVNQSQYEQYYSKRLEEEREAIRREHQIQIQYWKTKCESCEQQTVDIQNQLIKDLEVNVQNQETLNRENETAYQRINQMEAEMQALRDNLQESQALLEQSKAELALIPRLLNSENVVYSQDRNPTAALLQHAMTHYNTLFERAESELNVLKEDRQNGNARNAALQERMETYKRELDLVQRELSLVKADNRKYGDRKTTRNETLQELSNQVAEVESAKQIMNSRMLEMEEEILQLQEDNDRLEERIKRLMLEREKLEENVLKTAFARQQKASFNEEKSNKRSQELLHRNEKLLAENAILEDQLAGFKEEIERMRTKLASVADYKTAANENYDALRQTHDDALAQNANLMKDLLARDEQAKKDLQRYKSELRKLENSLREKLQAEIAKSKADRTHTSVQTDKERQQRSKAKAQEMERLEHFISSLTSKNEELQSALTVSQQQMAALSEQLEQKNCVLEKSVDDSAVRKFARKIFGNLESLLDIIKTKENVFDMLQSIRSYLEEVIVSKSIELSALEQQLKLDSEQTERAVQEQKEKAAVQSERMREQWKKRYGELKAIIGKLKEENKMLHRIKGRKDVEKQRNSVMKAVKADAMPNDDADCDTLKDHLSNLMSQNVKLQHRKDYYKTLVMKEPSVFVKRR